MDAKRSITYYLRKSIYLETIIFEVDEYGNCKIIGMISYQELSRIIDVLHPGLSDIFHAGDPNIGVLVFAA